jgi:hypothetical protein
MLKPRLGALSSALRSCCNAYRLSAGLERGPNFGSVAMRVGYFAIVLALGACGAAGTTAPSRLAAKPPQATPANAAPASSASPPAPLAQPASSPFWDHNLLALIPEIDACIATSPHNRTVTFAGRYRGALLVRLEGDDDAGVDCSIVHGHLQTAPRDAALEIAGDGRAVFIRGPGENPGGDCYIAPEVRDAHGRLLGWMIDPEGC